jgi:hypothetical protein
VKGRLSNRRRNGAGFDNGQLSAGFRAERAPVREKSASSAASSTRAALPLKMAASRANPRTLRHPAMQIMACGLRIQSLAFGVEAGGVRGKGFGLRVEC